MKVAHLAEFGPHKSGLYGTTRDLILAEMSVGIDAALVDSHVTADKKQIISRPNLKDGDLPIRDIAWAKTADILVHHSIVHQELRNLGIPIVLALHGRPESTFLLEHRRIMSIFGGLSAHGEDHRYKAFFTFWQEYMFHNELQLPKDKLFYVPAPCDLKTYSPAGKGHNFAGSPSILIVDMWRHDVTPYNTIMAATLFKQKYAPNAKLHIIGAAPKKDSMKALIKILKKDGVLGEVHPLVENTELCYRGADMVITPHNIATRVVRESLACGTPIVAGTGNRYTPYVEDSRDAEKYADKMNELWQWIKGRTKEQIRAEVRAVAEREFSPTKTGLAAKKLFEDVLEKEKGRWKSQDGLERKVYANYADYVRQQKSKLDGGIAFLAKYDKDYRAALRGRLEKLNLDRGLSVLCLGARTGTEVKAFLDIGCFAMGVDLNPGKDNKYVVSGDFHDLQYADNSVDCVFTNSLDHVYRPRKFLNQITRVLRPGRIVIVELEGPKDKDADKWASLHWDNEEALIELFAEYGLIVKKQTTFESLWFRQQIVFVKKGVASWV